MEDGQNGLWPKQKIAKMEDLKQDTLERKNEVALLNQILYEYYGALKIHVLSFDLCHSVVFWLGYFKHQKKRKKRRKKQFFPHHNLPFMSCVSDDI